MYTAALLLAAALAAQVHAASWRLPVGSIVGARADLEKQHTESILKFSLGGGSHGSALEILGQSRHILNYRRGTNCGLIPGSCEWSDWVVPPLGYGWFNEGNITFMVEHGPSNLTVWKLGHPDTAISVPVPDEADLLELKPSNNMIGSMAVHFGFRPSAPLDLAAYGWNRTAVFLRWRPPLQPGGELRSYSVVVDGQPEAQVDARTRCRAWPTEVCWAVSRPDSVNPVLQVSVRATNDWEEGRGDKARASLSTASAAPLPVEDLQATRVTPDSLELQWRQPRLLNGDLCSFRVTTERLSNGSAAALLQSNLQTVQLLVLEIRKAGGEEPDYTSVVGGLLPAENYNVTVECRNDGGRSLAWKVFSTAPAAENPIAA